MSIQAPSAVVMIRPRHFTPKPEAVADNSVQSSPDHPADETARRAFAEVSRAADTLREAGVTVQLFDDDDRHHTPDSVFPNNWLSTHPGGHVAVYPMFNTSRLRERRTDVLEFLKQHYRVQDVIGCSGLEHDAWSALRRTSIASRRCSTRPTRRANRTARPLVGPVDALHCERQRRKTALISLLGAAAGTGHVHHRADRRFSALRAGGRAPGAAARALTARPDRRITPPSHPVPARRACGARWLFG